MIFANEEEEEKKSMKRVSISDYEAIHLPQASENIPERKMGKKTTTNPNEKQQNPSNTSFDEVRKQPSPSQPSIKCRNVSVKKVDRGSMLRADT